MLFSEESSGRIIKLLNTGRDVLIREYEKDGVWYMYSRPTTYVCSREICDLYKQCYDQEEPFRVVPGKRLRGCDWASSFKLASTRYLLRGASASSLVELFQLLSTGCHHRFISRKP